MRAARALFAAVLLCLAAAASAQQVTTAQAPGAVLRGLDKVSGALTDIEIAAGATTRFGRLEIRLGECRYPVDDPSSNAYAWITIRDGGSGEEVFAGWMIAASPALNALDHPRYDVWLLRCRRA